MAERYGTFFMIRTKLLDPKNGTMLHIHLKPTPTGSFKDAPPENFQC